jgi:ATP-dependent exoDNAse (exonuclease V) alpha subunit
VGFLSQYSGLVQLKEHQHNPTLSAEFSTHMNLKAESWSVNFVNRTQGHCDPLGKVTGVDFGFRSDEQQKVVLESWPIEIRSVLLEARAGAGKTTSLQEIRKGLESAGPEVYYLAPRASAAQVLKKDGFFRATTVSDILCNRVPSTSIANAVLVVDEAGLQSTTMGEKGLKVEKNGCRLLFVGDTRQHSSVEAGDFLRILETHWKLHTSELKDIRRQLRPEYNVAIRTLASGQAVEGIRQLDAMGWVHEGKSRYIDQGAQAYLDATEGGI